MGCSAREGGLGATGSRKADRALTWLTRDTEPGQGEQSTSHDSNPVQPTAGQVLGDETNPGSGQELESAGQDEDEDGGARAGTTTRGRSSTSV